MRKQSANSICHEDYTIMRQLGEYMTQADIRTKYKMGGRKQLVELLERYRARRKHLENIKPSNITWREAWELADKHGDEYLADLKRKYEANPILPSKKGPSHPDKPYGEFSHDSSDHYEDGGAVFNGGWP